MVASVGDGSMRDEDELALAATAAPIAGVVHALRETAEQPVGEGEGAGSGELSRDARIGRYVVVGFLASGGMGQIYEAMDPELDRRIALKLVGAHRSDPASSARLLREAQALAQLSDPNVVTVYDAGRYGDDVYLAMELIEGTTLRTWLRDGPRPRADALEVLVAAGRGLAAAHRAGIVHRDFTTGNVIIGADGRVRVIDFGLARTDAGPSRQGGDGEAGRERVQSSDLTIAGARLGTPAYMAPEQHAGADVDSRADQFAFCVVLYEALRGQRPFAGRTLDDLAENVRTGRTVEPIESLDAPSWVRSLIARGLAPQPEDRFPSMDALLGELTRDRTRRVRRLALIGLIVALTGTSAAAARLLAGGAPPPSPCESVADGLVGAWDSAVAPRVRSALGASGRGYARVIAERVGHVLDRYANEWVSARREACTATVRGAKSALVVERRNECLGRRRDKLAALTTMLSSPVDADVLEQAIDLAYGLPAITDCADDETLMTTVPLPDDAAARAAITAVRDRLDVIEARALGGAVKPALVELDAALADARATAYAPVVAEALFMRGSLESFAGDPRVAEQMTSDAIRAAADAKDDLLAARAWTQLIGIVGDVQARHDDALALQAFAEAALARADADALLRAELLDQIGNVRWAKASYGDARALHQRAYDLRRTQLPDDDPRLAASLQHLGGLAWSEGRLDEARALLERAIEIEERALGAEHPKVMRLGSNLGAIAIAQGDLDAAERYHRQSLTIAERAMGSDHFVVGASANNLADVARMRGRFDEAHVLLDRAEMILVRIFGRDHPHVFTTIQSRGELALAEHQPALAAAHFERALAGFEASVGADHPFVAFALTGIGLARLANGKPREAMAPLERALAIREAHETAGTDLATTRWALAQALDGSGEKDDRALRLAAQARDAFATAPPTFAPHRIAIDDWMAKRR
jgi:eukaryotic-like serine/threonine-protein kinase